MRISNYIINRENEILFGNTNSIVCVVWWYLVVFDGYLQSNFLQGTYFLPLVLGFLGLKSIFEDARYRNEKINKGSRTGSRKIEI